MAWPKVTCTECTRRADEVCPNCGRSLCGICTCPCENEECGGCGARTNAGEKCQCEDQGEPERTG